MPQSNRRHENNQRIFQFHHDSENEVFIVDKYTFNFLIYLIKGLKYSKLENQYRLFM